MTHLTNPPKSDNAPLIEGRGVICLKGGIYSDERCPICNGRFKHFEPHGLWCPGHPQCRPHRLKVKFGKVLKRFRTYESTPHVLGAYRFLIGLRIKTDEGDFDIRDYQKSQPLGFKNLALDYLDRRKKGRGLKKVKCLRNIRSHLGYGIRAWDNRNIKEIGYSDFEDFFLSLPEHLSDKTIANIKTTLHAFWVWCSKRYGVEIPDFPVIEFTLGWRNTIDKATQQAIISEVKRISWGANPKIWVGTKWLATYISIRPIELIHVQHKDFRHDLCGVDVWYSKTDEPRFVPFLKEDMELAQSFDPALPNAYFFRHERGKGGPGGRFGKDRLSNWWTRACDNLGVKGVPLYPGTCHSSARALRLHHSPEEIKRAMRRKTNAAFERYFQLEMDDIRSIYADTVLTPKSEDVEKGKVLTFKD